MLTESLRILLADDHPLFRDGFSLLLKQLGKNIEILHAIDYPTLIQQTTAESFDLVLIDLDMPGYSPMTSLKELRKTISNTPLVIISANEDPAIVQSVLKQDIQGYLPKSTSNVIIIQALQLVLSGGRYLPPLLLDQALASKDIQTTPSTLLTEREREVLALLALGLANKEIARKLDISSTTVKSHITSIFRTLNVRNRTEASRYAIEQGLV